MAYTIIPVALMLLKCMSSVKIDGLELADVRKDDTVAIWGKSREDVCYFRRDSYSSIYYEQSSLL